VVSWAPHAYIPNGILIVSAFLRAHSLTDKQTDTEHATSFAAIDCASEKVTPYGAI